MRVVSGLLLVSCLMLGSRASADGSRHAVEVVITVPGLDRAHFIDTLTRETSLSFVVVGAAEERRARSRLELGFDRPKSTARVAYHDGESAAPALVVVAHFAEGMTPDERWFLAQAEAAIRSFESCESTLRSSPPEVLNPWSPVDTAMQQRWAEVLDPWLGCSSPALESQASRANVDCTESDVSNPWHECGAPDWGRAPSDWPSKRVGDPLLEGEVLDPWAEAAYAERAVALGVPRPGMTPRRMTGRQNER